MNNGNSEYAYRRDNENSALKMTHPTLQLEDHDDQTIHSSFDNKDFLPQNKKKR